jgi:hypothetical protein
MGNLPIVPITDLTIKNKDLIVATQGRSFWILDDLSVIQQWKPEVVKRPIHLFASRPTYRMRGGGSSRPGATRGQNIRAGVPFWINVKEPLDEASTTRLEVRDSNEQIVTVFSTKPDRDAGEKSLSLNPGLNRIDWDMRYPGAKSFEGMVLWGGGLSGPLAVPGEYTVSLVHQLETSEDVDGGELTSAGDDSKNRFEQQVSFEIKKDPRSSATREDLQVQFEFLVSVRDKLTEVHESIKRIRDIQDQLKALKGRLDSKHSDHKSIIESADKLIAQLEKVEKRLYQTKNQSPQDPLNFPIRLNNRLSSLVGVASMGDNRPTRQAEEVRQELVAEIDALLSQQSELIRDGVEEFNKAVQSAGIPAIFAGQSSKL